MNISRFLRKVSDKISWQPLSVGRKIYYGLLVVIAILAIDFISGRTETLKKSVEVLRSIDFLFIGLALGAQIISYIGSAYIIKSMLHSFSVDIPLYVAAGYEIASESVGVLAGGVVVNAAAMYYFLRSYGIEEKPASIVGWVPDITNLFSHALLAGLGFLFLLSNQLITDSIAIGFLVSISVLVIFSYIFVRVFWEKRIVKSMGRYGLPAVNYFKDDSITEEDLNMFIDEIYEWWENSTLEDWSAVAFGETVNVVFDVLTVYVLFLSVNVSVSFGLLVAGYAIPFLFAKVIPGGFGIVEGGMMSIYILGGVPAGAAAFLVIAFRLFSLWLPLFVGTALATTFGWRAAR